MTTVPCPRCGLPVGLDEEICPHCRAPRDFLEMEEGRALVRREEARLRRRPKLIAAAATGLVIVSLSWVSRARIAESLTSAWTNFADEVERTRDPRRYRSAEPIIDASAGNSAAPASPSGGLAISSFVYLGGEPPAMEARTPEPEAAEARSETFALDPITSAEAGAATAAPAPPAPGDSIRRYYGVIYDLDTLKPIGGAKLVFKEKNAENGLTAMANNRGHYQMDFFKGTDGTLAVSADIPGYRPGLFEDKDPPLYERPRDARKRIADELTESDLDPVPLRFRESSGIVQLDLVVVPKAAR